jgi:RND family efflux transporter MFP subunit
MVSLDDLEIVSDVPEHLFREIRKGAAVEISFEALPGLEVEGEVTAVIPRADPQARTFPVKVRVANPEGRVGVGMLARVAFAAGAEQMATIVPKDAVTRQGGQELVFLLGEDDTAQPVPVETHGGAGVWVAVSGPIQPGQKVIVRGNERLMPGQKVAGEPQEYELP